MDGDATETERSRQRDEHGDAGNFDYDPPLEEVLAECLATRASSRRRRRSRFRWSPLEPGDEALVSVRAGDGM